MQSLNGDAWTREPKLRPRQRKRVYHNTIPCTALATSMLLARATLRRAGWSVVTFTLLREPHDLTRHVTVGT